jgi:hypothetical protein
VQAALVSAEALEMETWVEAYRPRVDINTEILIGPPFLQIIRQGMRNGHDLVIKLPENQAWLDRLFGRDDSESDRLLGAGDQTTGLRLAGKLAGLKPGL